MPNVHLELEIAAPIDTVWDAVVDIESFPASMDSVRSVKIIERRGSNRRSAWSVLLQGAVLQWEEEETLDREARAVTFRQLNGDLAQLDGRWCLVEREPDVTAVHFDVFFQIGIPLLAEMLDPVAQRSLRENSIEMLRGIEREVAIDERV
jgi:uncharacterized membrane protein